MAPRFALHAHSETRAAGPSSIPDRAIRGRRILPLVADDPAFIGGIRLIHRLPPGGQGCDVFVGKTSPGSGRTAGCAVVKVLPASADRTARRLFSQEVAVATSVRSKLVPEVLAADLRCTTPYYAQELVPGLPLSELLSIGGGRLGSKDTETVAIELLRALADVHAQGIIHGDVKPGNLVVDDARLWLIDFGLGRMTGEDDTGLLVQRGTKHYSSPEHFRVDTALSSASDVFAWGLVVARSASGRHPVDPTLLLDDRAYYRALTTGARDLWPLTGALRTAVERSLHPEPDARGAAAGLLALLDPGRRPVFPPTPDCAPTTTVRRYDTEEIS
ncbi:Protein kinase domain-containing protein [Klenkia soli]|uniref:non-specific serine/threonine protein kinase n=1 Tax=Klenkia soli TaxID=1052260 RepID=A0A1H0NYF8_9ACTN|nr:protein kinase [Klenkia soli]SDO97701.1 Protein kinase domain-containing protein [Klenkia soli]